MPPTNAADRDVRLAHDAGTGRPVVTYYDDATRERFTLTATALGRWAARSAALLRDGCRLDRGARVAVLMPPHWQTAAILLGAWSAGLAVSTRPWATAGLAPTDGDGPVDAVFVAHARVDSWLETVPDAGHRFVAGLAPHGAPLDEVPSGYRDYIVEVGRQPDTAPPYETIGSDDPASPDGTSFREWEELARGFADRIGLGAGDRLLVDVAEREQPVMWLLAPLTVGASVVLCANLDPDILDARMRAEGITHIL